MSNILPKSLHARKKPPPPQTSNAPKILSDMHSPSSVHLKDGKQVPEQLGTLHMTVQSKRLHTQKSQPCATG